MKITNQLICACIFIAFLSSCTASRTKMENADYGLAPNNARSLAIDFMRSRLKDSESARITYISGPQKAALWHGIFGGHKFYWSVDLSINAKNSFGGYTGKKTWAVLFKNQRPIKGLDKYYYGDLLTY